MTTPHREERNPPVETLLFESVGRELDRNVLSMVILPAKPGTEATVTIMPADSPGVCEVHKGRTCAEALRAAVESLAVQREAA